MGRMKEYLMNEESRELDLALANVEDENRYLKAHIAKLMGEIQMLTEMMRHMSERINELEKPE